MAKKVKNIEVATIPVKKRSLFTKRRVILTVLLLIAGFIIYNFINRNTISTETTTVTKGNITESLSASGEITATKKAVLAFQSVGQVDNIAADEGDWVTEGQLIAKLDTTNLYQAYLSAEASLRSAEAALASTYDTVQGHKTDESFAQRATRTGAEAAKDIAYRNFVAARQNLANARIIAPFSGILVNISDGVYAGANIMPGSSTFTVVDPQTVYFNANVNEVDVVKLKNGQEVLLKLDAFPNDEIKVNIGDISFSSITTSTGGTAYPVKITLPVNSDNKFRLGMNGDAEFIMSSKNNVLLVPSTSVVEENNKEYVWTIADGKTKKVEVKTGISTIDNIEILEGLTEGQEIISRPPKEIRDGVKIKKVSAK